MVVREQFGSSRPSGPIRTCVGCRRRAAKQDLLRVVVRTQGHGLAVVPDPVRRAPGRGAYLHPDTGCLDLALARRAFPRAFRLANGITGEPVRDHVRHLQQ